MTVKTVCVCAFMHYPNFQQNLDLVTEVYLQWSDRDEAVAAEMLVMVDACRSRQRSTNTHRLAPDEDE